MKISIPFQDHFREPMLAGVKTMTSRTRRYGQPGDTFQAWGQTFELMKVYTKELGWVEEAWRCEGCSSPFDFRQLWNALHPLSGYYPNKRVYVHEFKALSQEMPK